MKVVLVGISMLVNPVFSNACCPMDTTDVGISTVASVRISSENTKFTIIFANFEQKLKVSYFGKNNRQ